MSRDNPGPAPLRLGAGCRRPPHRCARHAIGAVRELAVAESVLAQRRIQAGEGGGDPSSGSDPGEETGLRGDDKRFSAA